ncbi:MAG: hypothetical protein ACRD1W_16675 [Vicinamibacterales bacterium]
MKHIAGGCAAMAISTVGLVASTFATASVDNQTQALVPEEVTAVGCLRAWKPAAEDVTKLPENREPGMAGMFVLTPVASSPTVPEVPTYLLTPTATVNFQQHLDRKVEVVGVPQAATKPPTVQEIALAHTQLPENRPDPQSFPRLTVRTMTRLSDSCPS